MRTMDHTVTVYEDELRELSKGVDWLGGMVLQQLDAALHVIAGEDERPADEIIAHDRQLNAAAQEIERKAVRLIALRQPMADDLRRTVVALKCALELERCGDLAKNIAKRSLRMDAATPDALRAPLERLGSLARAALERSLKALLDRDMEAARAVWREDDAVDEAHERLVRALLSQMSEEPRLTTVGAQLLFVAKNLERIGDHATNIAEMVYFAATGDHLGERERGADTTRPAER